MDIEYRGYIIEHDGSFGMKKIKAKGSGALPKALKGSFTNSANAIRVIDLYLAEKEASNGKEVRTN